MRYYHIFVLIIILLITGCSTDTLVYYKTMEEAIQHGLEEEGIKDENILSIEEYKEEIIIFFEKQHAIGIANITKEKENYAWKRLKPLLEFQGNSDYYTSSFHIEIDDGERINILIGKIVDSSIQEVRIKSKIEEEERVIWNKNEKTTQFYYSIIEKNLNDYEVIVIRY